VSQIASIVATHAADIRRLASDTAPCQLAGNPRCDLNAQLELLTLDFDAEALAVELRAAAEDRPGNQLYIGAYPAELVQLVANTRSALATLDNDLAAYTAAGCSKPAADEDDCAAPAFDGGSSVKRLVGQIDAWGPYL
jgi:hypothetical protein